MNPRQLALLSFCLLTISCSSGSGSSGNTGSRISPTYSGPAELSYCSTPIDYSGVANVTITGTAQFKAREILGDDSTCVTTGCGLGAAGSALPIQRAEVRVTSANGTVMQCDETDASGNFSFLLPQDGATYTVSVNSRSNNSYLYASVLDAPERNNFYSLSTTVTATSSSSVGTLLADVTGDVLGGAFNILDQLRKANAFLTSKVGACPLTGCVPFTTTPKLSAYWEKGFNPGSYFNTGGLSFYLPGYSRLFILGGENGDVDNSDTDQFDNSVIIHEYGHFIEDVITASDSPGGSHDGDSVIDPRLAWSEGWGDFIQAAVLNDPHYIDTYGNESSGHTGFYFYVDLETASVTGLDVPQLQGEGNFRELSVTRMLWDANDSNHDSANSATDNVDDKFQEIWAALTSTDGFKSTSTAFRDVGLLHQAQATRIGASTDWTPLRTIEKHVKETQDAGLASNTERFRREYALYVDDTPSCSYPFSITPYNDPHDSGTFASSHLLRNNDFFFYKHPGGNFQVTLTYQSTGTEADLDLYVYKESARFGNSSDWVGYSQSNPDENVATSETETVTKSNLAAGDYLINVKVWTGGTILGGATSYELSIAGGAKLCPAPQP